jgi:hypothetical protein
MNGVALGRVDASGRMATQGTARGGVDRGRHMLTVKEGRDGEKWGISIFLLWRSQARAPVRLRRPTKGASGASDALRRAFPLRILLVRRQDAIFQYSFDRKSI